MLDLEYRIPTGVSTSVVSWSASGIVDRVATRPPQDQGGLIKTKVCHRRWQVPMVRKSRVGGRVGSGGGGCCRAEELLFLRGVVEGGDMGREDVWDTQVPTRTCRARDKYRLLARDRGWACGTVGVPPAFNASKAVFDRKKETNQFSELRKAEKTPGCFDQCCFCAG